jgi:2,3-dihydroxybenzoate-AMP ligase
MPKPITDGTVPWPAVLCHEYRSKGYWEDQPLGKHIWDQVDRAPDAVAVVDGDVRLTYRQLAERSDACAQRLAEAGLRAGDRVLVQLPNRWEFLGFALACFRLGVAPVMALPAHRRYELAYLAAHSESVAIVVPDVLRDFDHQTLAEELAAETDSVERVIVLGDDVHPGNLDLAALLSPAPESVPRRRAFDAAAPKGTDVACFLLSGGTTGLPKLITRTHNDYVYNAKQAALMCELDTSSVYLVTLPVSHNFPLACPGALGTLMTGGRSVMLGSPAPDKAFRTIAREGVTITAVVPAVARRWIDHQREHPSDQLASLRVLQVGGSRLPDEIAAQVRPVLGTTLQQVFGMAEGLINTTRLDDPDAVIQHTQGRPMSPGDEVLVVDEHGKPVRDGGSGALLTRGPYTPRGYYRAEEQNARAFTSDGWYRSGDVVSWHPSGNLVVEGRDKDMINRGGEKISAEEIENFGYQLADVAMIAAVAMPDATLGERLCVYVVPRPGAAVTLADLHRVMREAGVAAFKLPDALVLVDDLPVTKVGKISKKDLREDLARRLAAGAVRIAT